MRRLFADALTGSGGRAKPGSHRVAAERLGDFADRLPLALGDTFYDPIYAEAERLGTVLGIHGTHNTSRELGTSGLATFSEVHSYAFSVGILLQFTSMVCQGLTLCFPKLKLAFSKLAPLGCLMTSIDWTSTGETR